MLKQSFTQATVPCVGGEHVPGGWSCRISGEHRVTCPDHPGWVQRPGVCTGCLPRLAEVGFLCHGHFLRLQGVWEEWGSWRRAVEGLDRAAQAEGDPGRSTGGRVPLTALQLTVDQCDRLLVSKRRLPLEVWVSSLLGARDAVRFGRAAVGAYRGHPVEEGSRRLRHVHCTRCGAQEFYRIPPRWEGALISITCESCGHTILEGDMADTWRLVDGQWERVSEEAISVIARIEEARHAERLP